MENYRELIAIEKAEALMKAKTAMHNCCYVEISLDSINAENKIEKRNVFLNHIKHDSNTFDIITVLIYINSIY
jgi:hypothetical protein